MISLIRWRELLQGAPVLLGFGDEEMKLTVGVLEAMLPTLEPPPGRHFAAACDESRGCRPKHYLQTFKPPPSARHSPARCALLHGLRGQ